MTIYPVTWCSNCGREFGPGPSGFSHCFNHTPAKLKKRAALVAEELARRHAERPMPMAGAAG